MLVYIMDFISSKVDGDGGDSWRHKMRKAAVIMIIDHRQQANT